MTSLHAQRPRSRRAARSPRTTRRSCRRGRSNLHLIVGKRLTLRGFIILDHNDRLPAMIREVGTWLANGKLVAEETVVDGLDNAPAAFLGMLRGENTGKMVVRL